MIPSKQIELKGRKFLKLRTNIKGVNNRKTKAIVVDGEPTSEAPRSRLSKAKKEYKT
jgi:hypothetical protein